MSHAKLEAGRAIPGHPNSEKGGTGRHEQRAGFHGLLGVRITLGWGGGRERTLYDVLAASAAETKYQRERTGFRRTGGCPHRSRGTPVRGTELLKMARASRTW